MDELYAEAERRFPGDPRRQSVFIDTMMQGNGQVAPAQGGALTQPAPEDTMPEIDRNFLMRGMYEAMESEQQLARDESEMRREHYRQAADMLRRQRLGPSRSDTLFALSSAFLSPTPYRGFKGTMANVAPVLQEAQQARTDGRLQQQQALMDLMQRYQEMELEGRRSAAAARRSTYGDMADLLPEETKPWRGLVQETGQIAVEGEPVVIPGEQVRGPNGIREIYRMPDGRRAIREIVDGVPGFFDPDTGEELTYQRSR